ncbi:unnamed protein product, partial [Ascophyllum nodosum]
MGIPPEFSDPSRDEVSTFKIFDFVVEGIKGDFCVARSTTVAFLVLLLSYAYLPLLCWRRPRRIRRRPEEMEAQLDSPLQRSIVTLENKLEETKLE